MKHYPVLLYEALEGLNVKEDGIYVDGTFGAGGHSAEILKRLGADGILYGFDRDLRVLEQAKEDQRLRLRNNDFSDMVDVLRADGISGVDGVLLDLGVSSMQFDEGDRGFSYRFPAELDMRMNRKASLDALKVVNQYSAGDLQRIFSQFGEIRNAKTLAEGIEKQRSIRMIQTTGDLGLVAERYAVGNKMRYLSQVFQAIRMEVNDEIGELKKVLSRLEEVVKPGGRVVIISFHSLEDRLVKNFLKSGSFENKRDTDVYGKVRKPFEMITKKPVVAGESELLENIRSRSAKMRIGERI